MRDVCLGARVQEFLIRLEYLLLLSHRVTHLGTSLVAQWLKEKKKKTCLQSRRCKRFRFDPFPGKKRSPE